MPTLPVALQPIPARSHRQAMDWSLVLLSQGIESIIETNDSGWVLLVPPDRADQARAALAQYRHENRRWHWGRPLPLPNLELHPAAVLWCLALAFLHLLAHALPSLQKVGILDSRAVEHGSLWLLFTATTLHADVAHLALNLVIGFLVLGLAMSRFGPGPALLASLLAGVAGNLVGLWFRDQAYFGLGASGAVMGALGLLAFQSLTPRLHRRPAARFALTGLAGAVFLFILLGTAPKSDLLAHAGGFVAGLALGLLLVRLPHHARPGSRFNFLCLLTYATLLVVAWFIALTPPAPQ